jgi:hypothetical protein
VRMMTARSLDFSPISLCQDLVDLPGRLFPLACVNLSIFYYRHFLSLTGSTTTNLIFDPGSSRHYKSSRAVILYDGVSLAYRLVKEPEEKKNSVHVSFPQSSYIYLELSFKRRNLLALLNSPTLSHFIAPALYLISGCVS